MIFLDVTKSSAGHHSGLNRVTKRLADEFGSRAQAVRWTEWDQRMTPADWFLTAELFSEDERPGVTAFLRESPGRKAAVFHDAIPLKFPHTTWPQSVARHPSYLKLLAEFDRTWAVSSASRADLTGFWRWQGVAGRSEPALLALGADYNGQPRAAAPVTPASSRNLSVLCVGILEPRKNQLVLLDAAEALWTEGLAFELHLLGRVNPHFGGPIRARVEALARKFPQLSHHESAGDDELARRYAAARVSAFPSRAEGCGLPVIESLWQGVPCVCSNLPVLRENADAGGCLMVSPDDPAAWANALRDVLTNDATHARLVAEATRRPLPTWSQAAQSLLQSLAG